MADNEQINKKSTVKTIIIGLSITIGILFILSILVKIDVGGIGSRFMKPIIGDVPILKYVLPKDKSIEKSSEENKQYTFDSVDEAIESIKATEKILNKKEKEAEKLKEENKKLQNEMQRLKIFEQKYNEFLEEKAEFDDKVVFNEKAPEIKEYIKYYEEISPQNAENIYKKTIDKVDYDEKVKEYAKTYQDMKPQQAATILEEMSSTDLNLVVLILEDIDSEQRAKILGAMTPKTAAKVTKKMAPETIVYN